MFVDNQEHYGHLVNSDEFNPLLTQPEFYMLISNQLDWENRYLHREYLDLLKPNQTYKQPCPDVYWFPIANDRFCDDLVKIVETYGKWSDGTNTDGNRFNFNKQYFVKFQLILFVVTIE